jgi:ComF family protein
MPHRFQQSIEPMRIQHRSALFDVVGLFLPRSCSGCDRPLLQAEQAICLHCSEDLPRTRFHDDGRNSVEQLFFGKLPLHAASAFLHFSRNGMVQHMLHNLKYRGDREAGLELGRRMARDLMRSVRFADVDAVIAVPLHPRKERQRGYNQAQVLVDGMREVWPMRDLGSELGRTVRTTSQTRRGRMERWTNVQDAFRMLDPAALQGCHVLIVDDVITTGATIEACARALQHTPDVRISVFACACA